MKGIVLALLMGFVALFCWLGVRAIAAARPADPVSASGKLVAFDYKRGFAIPLKHGSWDIPNDTYAVTIAVAGSTRMGPYRLHRDEFHRSGNSTGDMPDLSNRIGADVKVWYDRGTTDLIALQVDDDWRYSMDYFDHPQAKYWDLVARGLLLGSPGFLILAGMVAGLVISPFRHWLSPVHTGTPAVEDDDSGEAYAYMLFIPFAITSAVLLLAGQARWGSMQFWGLAVGALALITFAIVAAPFLDRLGARIENLAPVPRRMGSWALFGFMLGAPIVICVLLTKVLNAVASS